VLRLEAPGFHTVRYPVLIEREGQWDAPVHLPPLGTVRSDETFVPAGWALVGGDDRAPCSLPKQRVWIDSFVMNTNPVTHRAYCAFLDAMEQAGLHDEVDRFVPRLHGTDSQRGTPVYRRTTAGFRPGSNDGEDDWPMDWPVCLVDAPSAEAFLAWQSAQTGTVLRLPAELEYEKAARGVDGRLFPWGDRFDPSWCAMMESRKDAPRPAAVGAFTADCSVYGIRHLAGNMSEWTLDAVEGPVEEGRALIRPAEDDEWRVLRGGGWQHTLNSCRSAARRWRGPEFHGQTVGFRGCRSGSRGTE
jgi:serine/threonine-protein kinase